ncbi:hypothetical protein HMPREF2532_04951 [Bacteroides ovatus]|uniref:Uncharacterized protein n=1 Tax=Bacteroides ovatus (strain ATCC 8483 / DSM 1896 / JCM 5824 / BCRC 10623 / CCUG 4943 / NCTC 11153) TaxID=411476 RepID=A0AAN3AAD0_BACO1|nr:hypothetical protein BACOVA_01418 [Bacteroides ovatus ATCC 8483]EEO56571.1 hypothetical protein BSCG_03499 [Bacteroides sp. 2_2_4]KXT41076.1 hypothetical protein HMPREF2532_04951 [Bacteroides ovatus]
MSNNFSSNNFIRFSIKVDNLFYIGRSATISYTRFAATDKSINKL